MLTDELVKNGKACVDCVHFKEGGIYNSCNRPILKFNPVYGYYSHCPEVELERAVFGRCGPEAKYFQQKPPAALPKHYFFRFWKNK